MSKAAFAGLKAVQEIRFHLCQTGKGSEGVPVLAQELQEHEGREPCNAHPDPRGERSGGWPRRAFRYVSRDVMCSNFLSPGLACGSNPGRRPTRDESGPPRLSMSENYPLFGTSPPSD